MVAHVVVVVAGENGEDEAAPEFADVGSGVEAELTDAISSKVLAHVRLLG